MTPVSSFPQLDNEQLAAALEQAIRGDADGMARHADTYATLCAAHLVDRMRLERWGKERWGKERGRQERARQEAEPRPAGAKG